MTTELPTELPADVIAFLKRITVESVGPAPDAQDLLDKYGTTKTLADYGTITYTRRFRHHQRWEIVEHSPDGDRNTDGLHFRHDNEALSTPHLVPWPDDLSGVVDAGICDLLNRGWRLIPSNWLDREVHVVANPANGSEWGDYATSAVRNSTDEDGNHYEHYVLAREVKR